MAVGRVYVRVIPDTTGFAQQLKADLAEIRRTNPLTIDVSADLDRARAEVKAFTDARRRLDIEVHADVLKAQAEIARLDDVIYVDVEANTAVARAQIEELVQDRTANVRVNLTGLGAAKAQLTALRAGLPDFTSIGSGAAGLFSGAAGAAKSMTTLAIGAYEVINLVGGATRALEVMSGALLAVPAVALAGATALGVLGIAFSNFSDAGGAAGEVRDAFKDMADGAKELRAQVQDSFFGGLVEPVRQLGRTYLPMLTGELSAVAGAMGRGAKALVDFLNAPQTVADTATGLQKTAGFMDELARATTPFMEALRDISVVGSEFLPRFGGWIADAAEKFGAFIANARDTGQLAGWIEQGVEAIKTFGRSLENLADGFGKLFDLAGASGMGFLDTLERVTGVFDTLMSDPRVQAGLSGFFTGAKNAADILFSTVATQLPALIAAVGPAVGSIATSVAGLASQIVVALSPVIQTLAPQFASLADRLSGTFGAVIEKIAPAIATIGGIFITLVDVVGNVFARLALAIAPVIEKIGPPFQRLAQTVGGALMTAIDAIGPGLDALASAFVTLAPIVGQFAERLFPILASVFNTLAPLFAGFAETVLPLLLQAFTDLAPLVGELAETIFPILVSIIETLLPPLISLVEAVLPILVQLFEMAAPVIDTVVTAVAGLVQVIADNLGPVFTALMPLIQQVMNALGPIVEGGLTILKGIIEVITGLITLNWSQVWQGIKDIASGLWEQIKAAAQLAWNLIKDFIINPIKAAWEWLVQTWSTWAAWISQNVWEPIKTGVDTAWTWVKEHIIQPIEDAWTWVVNELLSWAAWLYTNIWQPIIEGVKTAWLWVKTHIIEPIQEAYDWVIGKLTDLKNWITGVWDDIVAIFSAPIEANIVVNSEGVAGYDTTGAGGTLQATGGYWTARPGGHRVIVGEAGQDEYVLPKPMLMQALQQNSRAMISALSGAGGGGTSMAIEVNNNGRRELDPHDVADAIAEERWLNGDRG